MGLFQVTLTLIKLKMSSTKPWIEQFKSIFQNANILKLGTFLGGFATLFRVSFGFLFQFDDNFSIFLSFNPIFWHSFYGIYS